MSSAFLLGMCFVGCKSDSDVPEGKDSMEGMLKGNIKPGGGSKNTAVNKAPAAKPAAPAGTQ